MRSRGAARAAAAPWDPCCGALQAAGKQTPGSAPCEWKPSAVPSRAGLIDETIAAGCVTDEVEAALALAPAALQGGPLTTALQHVARHLAAHAARCQLSGQQASAGAPAPTTVPRLQGMPFLLRSVEPLRSEGHIPSHPSQFCS